jgi:hypothetical protein
MATRATQQNTIPNVQDYVSSRVFDGVRVLDGDAKGAHIARVKTALAKRAG